MIKKLLAITVAALGCSAASAAYVYPKAPAGYGRSPSGATVYTPQPNDVFWDLISRQTKTMDLPGSGGARVGTAAKLGSAARGAAAAVIFRNPYVRTGLAIASWLGAGKMIWDEAAQQWKSTDAGETPVSTGREYLDMRQPDVWHSTIQAAFGSWLSWANSTDQNWSYAMGTCTATGCKVKITSKHDPQNWSYADMEPQTRASSCPSGWYITSGGCVQTPPAVPVTEEQFKDKLPAPMPDGVPPELPYPTPLPVEAPSPWFNPSPGSSPTSQPIRVPTGDPQPNPDYDPNAAPSPTNQPYRQSYRDYQHSPTTEHPWRLDVRDGYRYLPGPQGQKDPETVPNPTNPDPSTKPNQQQQPDLCEKNPDIVACEKGDIADTPLPPIPKLYERKYPEGLVGIWNQKSQQLKQSSAFTLADQLMPTALTVGTCPSWMLPLNFGTWNYGEYDVAPACWIWDVAKAIIIVSALILARALIFGG